jgi:hypothetical protein
MDELSWEIDPKFFRLLPSCSLDPMRIFRNAITMQVVAHTEQAY